MTPSAVKRAFDSRLCPSSPAGISEGLKLSGRMSVSSPAFPGPKLSGQLKVGRLARRPLTFRGAEDANRSGETSCPPRPGSARVNYSPTASLVNSDGTWTRFLCLQGHSKISALNASKRVPRLKCFRCASSCSFCLRDSSIEGVSRPSNGAIEFRIVRREK